MSKEKRSMPKLRFPGFTEDWEQRKFSEITYLSGIKNKENKPYESYSISNEFGFIPQNEQFEHGGTMKTADKSMYYIVTQNSFAYNPARINVGSIGYYDKPDNVIVSSLYEVFKTTEIVNDKFLWHWFKSNQFNHLIEKYQEGGVRLYFYYDKLCKGAIELPTIDEQNKISNLLNGLDLFITLHQRKLEHLNLKKKALLQKLFPKNGERYPELRFPGFTDAWEQCKLGDLAEIVRGASPRPISDPKWFDNDSNVGWLRIADVTAQDGRIRYLEQKISELGQEKTRVIKTPHLLLSIAATVGKPVINYVPTGVHDGFLIFLNPKFNILYAFWWLEMFREKWNKYGQPGSQVNLNSDLVKNQVINIPNEKEQEKISSFLESLDKIITLHQRKLEHLQLQKKALLQQMFV